MLALARAATLSSIAFVKQSYAQTVGALKPVAYWDLGDPSGLIIDEERDVQDGTYQGTPQGTIEYSLEPIVEHSVGTSVGFDGTHTYGQIPHNSAFELPSYTIDFAFQADTAPASGGNTVLLSKDTAPSPPGALSIELRNTFGQLKLRAYAGGPTGFAWIGSQNGVADIAVGRAYKVTVTVDATAGAKLWLDGALVASEPSSTQGLQANGQPIVLAAWSSGGLGKFDGVLDEVALFGRALSATDVGKLARATTINRASLSPADAINIPALDDFLANNGAPPTSPIYVYDTTLGDGSGSSPANAKEIQAAINAAIAGQNLVAIALAPGGISFYNRVSGLTWASANSGTSGSKITLSARPGDTVVISRGEAYAGARTTGSGFWEASPWDSSKKIWRSAAAIFGGARPLSGQWIEFGVPHLIPRYANLTDLSAPLGTSDMPTHYAGPGAVVHTDGRVYMRMQKPHPAKYSVGDKWPTDGRFFDAPGQEIVGGKLAFPVTENPNDYPIYLAEHGGTGFDLANRQHWRIGDGINSHGYQRTINPSGASNMEFGRGLHLNHRWAIQLNSGLGSNFTFHKTRFSIGSARHLSFVEFKFGQIYFESTSRGAFFETAGSSQLSNFHFLDCTMHGFFDLSAGGAPGGHRFIRCAIVDTIDDGLQHNPQTLASVEFGWCYILFAGYDGPGGGSGGNVAGAWFIHHNVMDYRALRVTNNATEPHPMSLTQHHSQNANRPAKVFNNTAITMTDTMDQQRIPFEHINRANNHPTIWHECFNNIMLVVNGNVGFSTRYNPASNFPGPSDGCIRGAFTTDKSLYTYNLYWRDPALGPFDRGIVQLDGTYYSSISAARSAKPGFEPNGDFEGKPSIPSIDNYPAEKYKYRPSADSNINAAYTNQITSPAGESMAGWPALPSPWKGALDPNGTTMSVGPQDP